MHRITHLNTSYLNVMNCHCSAVDVVVMFIDVTVAATISLNVALFDTRIAATLFDVPDGGVVVCG